MNPTTFFGRKISKTGVNVTQATDNQLVLKEDYNEGNTIYYDASGIPNVLIGLRPLTNVRGFYVSKPGIDVTKATDDELIFNSQQDTFKVVLSSTTAIPLENMTAGNTVMNTITIPHGLSFIPILDAYALVTYFVSLDGSTVVPIQVYTSLPYNGFSGIPDSSIEKYSIIAGVDDTNIYISYFYQTTSSGSGGTGYNFPTTPIRYYLRQETAK